LRNLLVNARLHARGQGVRAVVDEHEGSARLVVEDRGPGIPEGERDRIFAPFYRPAGPRPTDDTGIGLGLALVRQVALYHGGSVTYAPREGGGSRFQVLLPALKTF
jgi:signal transduction histidine kinase